MSDRQEARSAATAEQRRIEDLIVSRLREHLAMIAAVDWDYFAALRFRLDAKQAVSDLERLVRMYRKEVA